MAKKVYNGLDLQNQRIISLADPSSGTDAVTKQYVDNLLLGLRWKVPVRVATTANSALASTFENGDVIDGVTLATGDRILIKDQTAQTENGIYTVNASGAPTRATDADSTAELHGAAVLVTSGTANADKAFIQTTDNPTVGSSNLVWVQFGAGTSYSADGNGIELSSTTFSLELDGTTLSKSASGLRIGSGAAGNGLTEASGVLAVNTGTGLEVSADAVRLATQGTGIAGGAGTVLSVDYSVVGSRVSANVGDNSSTSIAVTHSLGTRDVNVQVYRNSTPWDSIECDVERNSTSQVTLKFATAPTTNEYRVVVS